MQSLRLSVEAFNNAFQVFAAPVGDDKSGPIKLYDVELKSSVNGQEMGAKDVIDFRSLRQAGPLEDPFGSVWPASGTPVQLPKEPEPLVWKVDCEISVSNDETHIRERLGAVRRKQAKFNSGVTLPEGLTPAEEAMFLQGTITEEQRAAREAAGQLIPHPGISYV